MKALPRFTSPIKLTPIPGGKLWCVTEGFAWHVGAAGSDLHVCVEAGFMYDLASVPWVGRLVVPHTTAPQSSALHDHGYRFNTVRVVESREGDEVVYKDRSLRMTRLFWDEQYRQAMIALDVPLAIVFLTYWGVRLGGKRTWDKYRRND